jgi:hypothetical protein
MLTIFKNIWVVVSICIIRNFLFFVVVHKILFGLEFYEIFLRTSAYLRVRRRVDLRELFLRRI